MGKQAIVDDRFAGYFQKFQWPWYMPKVSQYDLLVRQFDFRQLCVWEENADRYFASADQMTRWIDQPCLVPFLKYIEDHDKQRFREMVVEEMIQRTEQQDGQCFETFRRINVLARK